MSGADTVDTLPPGVVSSGGSSSGPLNNSSHTHNPYLWSWRGAGLIKFVSSKWEVLGYGGDDDGPHPEEDDDQQHGEIQWIVSHAQKSVFTPEHVNVFTRAKEGLGGVEGESGTEEGLGGGGGGGEGEKEKGLRRVKEAFEVLGREMGREEDMRRLVGGLYVVRQD